MKQCVVIVLYPENIKESESLRTIRICTVITIRKHRSVCYEAWLSPRCTFGSSWVISASFSGDNFLFAIASKREEIEPCLGVFVFTLSVLFLGFTSGLCWFLLAFLTNLFDTATDDTTVLTPDPDSCSAMGTVSVSSLVAEGVCSEGGDGSGKYVIGEDGGDVSCGEGSGGEGSGGDGSVEDGSVVDGDMTSEL